MLVQDLYLDCADTLLEPLGLTLGLVTDAQFIQYFRSVMEEFLSCGLYKAIALTGQISGTVRYIVPDWLSDVEAAFSDGAVLFRDMESGIAQSTRNWQSITAQPRSWRQDKQFMYQIEIYPKPSIPNTTNPNPSNFGIVAAWVPGGNLAQTNAFVGTMTQAGQVATFTSPGVFFGAQPLNTFSRTNLAMVGRLGLMTENVNLASPIEHLTDDWVWVLKYGILAKIFDSDSENRDVLRARYCRSRFDEGVMLARMIMDEEVDQAA